MNNAATDTARIRNPLFTGRRAVILAVALMALLATLVSTAQAEGTSRSTNDHSLRGTWLFDVPVTEEGTPGFQSLLTFHKGGTLTEVSDELALGLQGPAQGVWKKVDDEKYVATFQTWVFNGDTGAAEGRIQVRAEIEKTGRHSIEGWTVIDFIAPDGTVIPNIDRGPISATRMKLQAP